MKTPLDTVMGTIINYDEQSGTVTIHAHYDDVHTLVKRGYKRCYVELIDSRPLSDKQRRACFALLKAIADYSGHETSSIKELMKVKFMADELGETAQRIFSLSNAPMSLVCSFQRFLVRFILEQDIPCSFALLDFVDDTSDYVYHCLMTKHCSVCGHPAELHHIERVGMGRSREEIIHEGMEALALCRVHHNEAHTMSDKAFFERYHLERGIELDKTLCRIWKLKSRKKAREED